jgi:hypothetical protein
MQSQSVVRVVLVRKGRTKATEFRLRPGESGLSLFRVDADVPSERIMEAVKLAGKAGDLGIAEIPIDVLSRLGLKLVSTPGGTPIAEVNGLHIEARVTIWRRMVLIWKGKALHDYFNEEGASRISVGEF